MKMRSLLIIGSSLIILMANHSSVLAQIRQPTNAELRRLRQEFQQVIKSTINNSVSASYIQDRRTQNEKNNRKSFVNAWSKVEPKLAPFMGVWSGYESSKHIYPSNIRGRVCVIWTGDGSGSMDTGVFSNGFIKTSRGEVLFKEGNYLGSALLKNGKFIRNYDIPFNSPRPLGSLTKLLEYMYDAQAEKITVSQKFQAAGCTNSTKVNR
ncbi:hypothetical protein CV014_06845 [Nostoc sp. CMAA1605]|nr:hypothetical protein [Nostoc sp. CMAA1605]